MTAAELTKWAKEQLTDKGMRVNRVNNIPVRRRKGTVQKGWADLQGYSEDGIYVACEVKTKNDRLSPEQTERLQDIVNCGGYAYLCMEDKEGAILIPFGEQR